MCACALSGQDTSKGRIKAAAHAKDGDCFGCLIIPLRTILACSKMSLMLCVTDTEFTAGLPHFTKNTHTLTSWTCTILPCLALEATPWCRTAKTLSSELDDANAHTAEAYTSKLQSAYIGRGVPSFVTLL